MIEKLGGQFYLYCDICGEEADHSCYEFNDAVQYKKENSWKSRKQDGEWEDVCPECQETK